MATLGNKSPVWWDREHDLSGRAIRVDVRTAADQIWGSVCRRAQARLGDMSEAPELMEKAVVQVSRYLDRTATGLFTENTNAILMCAFCRSLRRYAIKLNRVQLVGGNAELSELRVAPDWTAPMELQLDLEKLGRKLTPKSQTMLCLRSSGFDWKEIATILQTTETAARAAFWREMKRARLTVLARNRRRKG